MTTDSPGGESPIFIIRARGKFSAKSSDLHILCTGPVQIWICLGRYRKRALMACGRGVYRDGVSGSGLD